MIYCKKCGTQNKKENKFCKSCGLEIKVVKHDEEVVVPLKKKKVNKKEKDKLDKVKKVEKPNKVEVSKKSVSSLPIDGIKEDLSRELKKEISNEVAEIKEEISLDIKEELKETVEREVEEATNEIKDDIEKEVDVATNEIKETVDKEVREATNEIKGELAIQIKSDVVEDLKEEVVKDLRDEIKEEVRNELSYTMEITGLSNATKKKKSSSPILLFLMIVVLAIGYFYFAYMYGPKHLAKVYMNNLISGDYDYIYDSVSISGDTTFVNKDAYLDLIKNNALKIGKISDFEIEDVVYSDDRSFAVVDVEVLYENESGKYEKDMRIEFSRNEKRKYFIFETWTMISQNHSGVNLIEDYKIYVPKHSKVKFNNISVDDKYIKNFDDVNIDMYVLPQVFEEEVVLSVTIPNGMEVLRNIKPSEYYRDYKLEINKNDFNLEEINSIKKSISSSIETIMSALISDKSFDSIRSTFASESNIDGLNDLYDKYRKLLKIDNIMYSDFLSDDVVILDIEYNHLYNYIVNVRVDYSWNYLLDMSSNRRNEFAYYTIELKYEDSSYNIASINDLPNIIGFR